jgi:uncharacterized membrane protein
MLPAMLSALALLLLAAADAGAAAPSPATAATPAAASAPPAVRAVPPAGIALPEAERKAFESELSALAQDLHKLRARAEAARFLPDVEIFYRAVDAAFTHDEFFAADELPKAHRLLALGRERAAALLAGKTPWLEKTGATVLGYLSKLDGSIQPYGLYLPETWTPRSPRRWRLDTWFHGRGDKLSEVNFIADPARIIGEFPRPDALILAPYGRFNNGSKFAGEVDFFEALADLQGRFAIDQDRITIRGFSLGGHSAWHLGAHHAARWAAVAPGAGFAESEQFLHMWEKDPVTPTWWERQLWQLYDAPAYAENFRDVPLVAYSGEIDKQKQAADLMTKVLAAVGIQLTHVIGPGTAHKYHPDARVTIDRLVDALAEKGRDPLPLKVALATPTLKYNRQAWIEVDALGEHWQKARVDGELDDARVWLKTSNVTALTVALPPGRAPFAPGRPPGVRIDGQKLMGPPVGSDRSWTAHLHKAGGRWAWGPLPEGLRKRHDLQGPIDDAFMTSFLIVTPSAKAFGGDEFVEWAYSEQMRAIKEWRRHFRGEPRVKIDKNVTDQDIAEHNLVLWGDPSSNLVLARLADKLPIRWTKAGISVGKQSYPNGRALALVYPNPLNPRRYVVLNSGFTWREYDYLDNARQSPKLPDWAVIDLSVKPDAHVPGKIVDAGFFGEAWELKPPHRAPPATKPAVSAAAP